MRPLFLGLPLARVTRGAGAIPAGRAHGYGPGGAHATGCHPPPESFLRKADRVKILSAMSRSSTQTWTRQRSSAELCGLAALPRVCVVCVRDWSSVFRPVGRHPLLTTLPLGWPLFPISGPPCSLGAPFAFPCGLPPSGVQAPWAQSAIRENASAC